MVFPQDIFFDMETVIRLSLAVILSGLIGIEREMHGRPAGLRTHVLVCLGTTVIILSGAHLAFLFKDILKVGMISMDPGRIAAGIITGIGFIGGGCIIRIGDYVRGLTTAACLWFVASLGIIVGVGLYSLAAVTTVTALFVLVIFEKIEDILPKLHYREMHLSFPADNAGEIENRCTTLFREKKLGVIRVKYNFDHSKGTGNMSFYLRMKKLDVITDIIDVLKNDETIRKFKIL